MSSKLDKYKDQCRSLRAENRDLTAAVEEYEFTTMHNPSGLRNVAGAGIQSATAYGGTRLYVYLQQRGMMPSGIPLDVIVGTIGRGVTSFFEGPISSVLHDIASGMADGGLGRLGALQQMKQTEVAGSVCYLVPSKNATPNNPTGTE